jgi:hypothetical protein
MQKAGVGHRRRGIGRIGVELGALMKAAAANCMFQKMSEVGLVLRKERRRPLLQLGISLGMKDQTAIGVGEFAEPVFSWFVTHHGAVRTCRRRYRAPSPPAFKKKFTHFDVSQLCVDWQSGTRLIVKEDGDNPNSAISCCNFTARQPFPVKVLAVGRYFNL